MATPRRSEADMDRVLAGLKQLWMAHPEQRLGQLLHRYATVSHRCRGVSDLDDIWIERATDFDNLFQEGP